MQFKVKLREADGSIGERIIEAADKFLLFKLLKKDNLEPIAISDVKSHSFSR
jgi:type II secretory pathway component PulF